MSKEKEEEEGGDGKKIKDELFRMSNVVSFVVVGYDKWKYVTKTAQS